MLFAAPLYLVLVAALFLVLPIMIGVYVYRDANSLGMNAAFWTLIAVLTPVIGLIIYLVVRSSSNAYECPTCKAPVLEEYASCPKCGTLLKAKCKRCGNVLSSGWQNCSNCGEPIPVGANITAIPKRKDNGLGIILVAVIMIPILIISILFFGLVSFRSSNPTSIGSVDGMRIEDFESNKTVSDWLKNCDASGTGIYVLEYQYPQEDSSGLKRSEYIVYRSGLTKDISVAAVGGFSGFFKESLKVEYTDLDISGVTDYHIYQVEYTTTEKVQLEVLVNGKKAEYKLTKSNDPLMFVDPVWWRSEADNLYRLRLEYLGDNSGVIALVQATGLEFAGDYTLELKTSEKPYGLKVIYSTGNDKFEFTDFSQYSTELLGLIKNLDYVEITNGENTFRMTAEEASQTLGHDVKDFGTDPSKLEAYLKSLYGDSFFD